MLDVYMGLPPIPSNQISPLYGTPESTWVCTVPHHISCSSAAFQFWCKLLVVTIERALFSCSFNGRAWDCYTKRIFSLVSLEFPYFHYSVPLVNRLEYLGSAAKISNLTSRKQSLVVWVSSCSMTRDTVEICQVLQAGMIL
jgi:hypothetical protein